VLLPKMKNLRKPGKMWSKKQQIGNCSYLHQNYDIKYILFLLDLPFNTLSDDIKCDRKLYFHPTFAVHFTVISKYIWLV